MFDVSIGQHPPSLGDPSPLNWLFILLRKLQGKLREIQGNMHPDITLLSLRTLQKLVGEFIGFLQGTLAGYLAGVLDIFGLRKNISCQLHSADMPPKEIVVKITP